MGKLIPAQIYLDDRYCILPYSEVFCRDPKNRTLIVWGYLVDVKAGIATSQKIFFELPQGVIQYQPEKEEILERIAVDQHQMVLVNGVISTAENAVNAVLSVDNNNFIVKRDDHVFYLVEAPGLRLELRYCPPV